MNSRPSAPFTLLSLLVAAGCGDQGNLDVGDETESIGLALSDYAAEWDGYAEAYQVPGDGTDRVRLVLDPMGAGTLRFGEEDLFPTPTVPEELYPPLIGEQEADPSALLERLPEDFLRSGFTYSVTGAQVMDERLQFAVELSELMDPWCALVTADMFPDFTCGGGGYTASLDEDGEQQCTTGTRLNTPINCNVAAQCSSCDCEGDTCVGTERGVLLFDAALTQNGNTLEGTLVTDQRERVTIRMTR